jgi:hypothetical protein
MKYNFDKNKKLNKKSEKSFLNYRRFSFEHCGDTRPFILTKLCFTLLQENSLYTYVDTEKIKKVSYITHFHKKLDNRPLSSEVQILKFKVFFSFGLVYS